MRDTGKKVLLSLLLLALLGACANVVRPSGGPRDTEGPKPDSAKPFDPPNESVNFSGKQITIHYDEFLGTGNYAEEIFISPVQKVAPQVMVKGKNLTIRLMDTLRLNTTYIVNIGKNIVDVTEGNPMAGPIVYAFSTGSKLDSLGFTGKVVNPWTQTGEPGFTMMLYAENEIVGDSIFDIPPVFACETDSSGGFRFNFLPPGRYRLYGVADGDKSHSWNQMKEKIAIMENPTVVLGDSNFSDSGRVLTCFQVDNDPPRLKSVKWITPWSMVAEFKDPAGYVQQDTGLFTEVGDTAAGAARTRVPRGSFRRGDGNKWYFEPGIPSDQWSKIWITQLTDTMGFSADTAVVVKPFEPPKKKKSSFREPFFLPEEGRFALISDFPLRSGIADSLVNIVDSSGNKLKTRISVKAFEIDISPRGEPKPKMPYFIQVDSGFPLTDSLLTDSIIKFRISIPSPDKFGNFSGEIETVPGDTSRWVMMVIRIGRKTEIYARTDGSRKFEFKNMPPGQYSLLLFRDDDGNGVWTTGSITPYKLPEPLVPDTRPLEIRAKWDLENYKVYTTPQPESAPGSGKKMKVE